MLEKLENGKEKVCRENSWETSREKNNLRKWGESRESGKSSSGSVERK